MTFKKGIYIEVDEQTYRTIEKEVKALNSDVQGPRVSMSRFVKKLVDEWVKGADRNE
jgi:hypothetical protein